MMYKITPITDYNGTVRTFFVIQNENGSSTWVPEDPANTDYQEYLRWLAEGNTPTPADEVTQ